MVLQLYRVRNHHVAWCGVAVIPCEPLEVVCTMRSRLHQSLFMSDDYSVDCLISIVDDISHITKMLEHQTTCLCPNALGNARAPTRLAVNNAVTLLAEKLFRRARLRPTTGESGLVEFIYDVLSGG